MTFTVYVVQFLKSQLISSCRFSKLIFNISVFISTMHRMCNMNYITAKAQINLVVCIWHKSQGPVVQSVVSLTSSLRVISLTVLADSVHNILIFFAEKM